MSKMKQIGNKLLICCCEKEESIYLCGSCFLRIPEQGVVKHLNGLGHQKMQHVVVKVNKKIYNDISKQNFFQAIITLDALHLWPSVRRPVSASSGKPGNASAAYGKHVTFVLDDCKIIKMDLDSEDNGAAKQMSVVTETSSKTTQVVFDITEDKRNTHKTVPTSNTFCQNSSRSILKRPAVASVCFRKAPSSTLKRNICSSASVAKSTQPSRLPQRRVFAPTKRASGSSAGSVVCEVTCRTASCSKMKKNPGYTKTVSKAAVGSGMRVTSVATTKMAISIEPLNTEASMTTARVKKSRRQKADGNPDVNVKTTLSAPHLGTIMSAGSEHRRPCEQPVHLSTRKRMASGETSKIGLNQLIIVSWDGRKQVYCQLCSVRLKHSNHTSSFIHCYNYLKIKYPELTLPLPELENKLNNIVAHLVELEKDIGFQCPQKVEVQKDVYQKLAALPEDKALKRVKAMLRQKPLVSSSTADTVEALGLQAASPCDVSSSNDGVSVLHNKMSERSDEPEQENKRLCQTLEVQMTETKDNFVPDSEAQSESQVQNPEIPDSEAVKALSHTEQPLESPQKLSPVQSPRLPAPGSATPGPETLLGPTYKAEQASKHGIEPEEQSGPQTLHRTAAGRRAKGSSYLSFFLKATHSAKPVIGMALVWECRGMSQKTFYLCESCEVMLSHLDICHHMVSHDHHLKYLWKNHPEFLQMFWMKEDLPSEIKIDLFYEVVQELASRECFHKVDAQCVLLGEELHQFVRTAQFSEALKMMQNIRNAEKPVVFSLPISTTLQNLLMDLPEEQFTQTNQGSDKGEKFCNTCPGLDPSPLSQSLLAPTLNTDHQNHIKAGQNINTEVEKMPAAEDVMTSERVSSPLDVNSLCSVSEPVVLPIPIGDLNSQDTSKDLSPWSRFTPASVQLQSSESQVELMSKSTSSVSVSSAVGNEFAPIRKRPADAAPESLLRPCTSSPLEYPLPAKHTPNPVKAVTESTLVNSSESSATLVRKDMGSKKPPPPGNKRLLIKITSKLQRLNSKTNCPFKSAPNVAKTISSCAATPSDNMKTRWDSKIVIRSQTVLHKRKWDSKCQMVKATLKNPPFNFVEEIKTAASVDLKSGVGSVSSAKISPEPFVKEKLPANLSNAIITPRPDSVKHTF